MSQSVRPFIQASRWLLAGVWLVSTLLQASVASATPQDRAGSNVHVQVADTSGAPIVGAQIAIQPSGGGATVRLVTDARGEAFVTLAPASYELTASAPMFRDALRTVIVRAAGVASVPFTLQIAVVSQSVDVTASAGYREPIIRSATKTDTPLRDTPQAVTVITKALISDQLMSSIGDVVRYVPGISAHQGENNRDQVIIRGNSSSADFFVNGVRDDVQYYRDLYNLDRVEALMGPNAMIFGRGGGGGVVNRVLKAAGFEPAREFMVQGGQFGNTRFTVDVNQPLGDRVAFRVNGLAQRTGSFRNGVNLRRDALSPTLTIAATRATTISLRYEQFHDERVADRGITSFQGRPADVPVETFYGNPTDSHVRADVNLGGITIDHQIGRVSLRNQTVVGDYDRSYQNFVPGAVTANQSQVALTAYNNATKRLNVFNQFDATYRLRLGWMEHTLLGGTEAGRQTTDNFRNTGYFNNDTTSLLVSFGNPTISTPVTFRQSATDADNHLITSVRGVYAQDQIAISSYVKAIVGARVDRFDLTYHNNRNGDTLARVDNLVSPRVGVVVSPTQSLSLYSSRTVSYLPSSGDQFSSLTTITQQVEPEKFTNVEVGVKWDVRPALSFTAATYRLDRTNTRSTDPNDPTRIVQTGSQRTQGLELGINGQLTSRWQVAGGYARQEATVTSATTSAVLGAHVAQVPRHMLSIWNNYQVTPRVGAAIGVINRAAVFAAIDNTVTLPRYTRVDLGVFVSLSSQLRLQLNVENVGDTKYFVNADSNTNITPGSPRAVRLALVTKF